MNDALVIAVLASAVFAATPILYAALGEIVAELAGVLNLGIEGMMLCGAVVAFVTGINTQSLWLAIGAGMAAGVALSLVHALLTVTLTADQVVSGLAITLFGSGFSAYFGKSYTSVEFPAKFDAIYIPVLSDIPLLGPVFFQQNALVVASYVTVPALWALLRYSGLGLCIRAVGESPRTADAMGINVLLVRYAAIAFGGLMAGLAGAFLSTAYLSAWSDGMTAGRGWIAIAVVVFAAWNPLKAVAGAYVFGFALVMAFQSQIIGKVSETLPTSIIQMAPYLLTVVVLMFARRGTIKRRQGVPAALMTAYVREQR